MVRHCLPKSRALRALDVRITNDEAAELGRMFATDPDIVKKMTFTNITSTSRYLIATKPQHICQNCCSRNDKRTINSNRRLEYLGWRFTCPLCRSLLLPADTSPLQQPFQRYHANALRGEKLLDDEAVHGIRSWISPANLARFLLSRRFDFGGKVPMDRLRVLGVILPEWDKIVANLKVFLPLNKNSILPIQLRPALLAGIAIVERHGPTTIDSLEWLSKSGCPHDSCW